MTESGSGDRPDGQPCRHRAPVGSEPGVSMAPVWIMVVIVVIALVLAGIAGCGPLPDGMRP